jgi:hypothetical protein
MRALRSARTAEARRRALWVLLVLVGSGTSLLFFPLTAARAPANSDAGSEPCHGTVSAPTFSGQLSLVGGPLLASSLGGVELSYSYWQESVVYDLANGSVLSTTCTEESGSTVTNASGGFSFSISPPGETCAPDPPFGETCTTYTAPYLPVTVSEPSGPPAGYGLSVASNGSRFSLVWVAGLATTTVTPSPGPVVASVGAAVPFLATARAANGTLSPLAASFNWTVSGPGWTFVAPPGTGSSASVEATAGAGYGNLTVEASATVGANSFRTPLVDLPLVSVPTTLESGRLNLTTVDAGRSVAVRVYADGAVGYPYTATIRPGLGLPTVTTPCASASASPTTVSVGCTEAVTYPTPGPAQLSVNVSNGFSAVTWESPNVTVVPAAALELSPAAPHGYAGTPIPITVEVAPGTGVPPYATACFAAATLSPQCEPTDGPSWTFRPTFSAAANYSATTWVVDAAGTNRSLPMTVHVVGAPNVGRLVPGRANASAGTPLTLSSSFSGGALPAEVWWNASGASTPTASYPVDSDGPLSTVLVPAAAGLLDVSLTVRDAFGTDVEANMTVIVTVGPATAIRLTGSPPAPSVVAGTPIPFEWQALNPVAERVASFAEPGVLSVAAAGGAPAFAWANRTGSVPLSAAPEGSFVVPASAWTHGFLNLTVTPISAGALTVSLGGPGIPEGGSGLALTVSPDPARLRLFDPFVAVAGTVVNHTFWHVSDRFGNPVPGAYLIVQCLSPAGSVSTSVGVDSLPGGGTGAWLNYTLPAGGTVRVLDAAGDLLLGPVRWTEGPVASSRALSETVLAASAPTGLAVALASASLRRKGRPEPRLDEDEAARRLAEGRASVVELVRAAGVARWETVEGAWVPRPAPPDLADWLASLVADGTLVARSRPGGVVEYRVAPLPAGTPQVTVDEAELDRVMARREAVDRGDDDVDA